MEIENHLEKQKELREQLAHQAEQISDLRADVNDRDHEIEDLQYHLDGAKRQLTDGEAQADETGARIQDYKAELSQKQRRIDELEKQLDIMSYDLSAAREHLDEVSETSSGAGAEVVAVERKLHHLQEIVTDKEGLIEELKGDVEARDEEIALLREDVESGGGASLREYTDRIAELESEVEDLRAAGRGGATAGKLNELKRANRELRHRVEELEEAGDGGGGGGGADAREVRGLRREMESLQEENDLLQQRIAKMSRRGGGDGGGDDDDGDAGAVNSLKRENRELRRRIRELEDQADDRGRGGGGVDPRLHDTVQSIGETIADWEKVFDSATYDAAEIKRLVEMLERIDLGGLEPRDRRKLEAVLRDVEPFSTLQELEDKLNDCIDRSRGMKRDIRTARRLLED